ncbi:MAG: SpoIID/LytB domain-containing protein [candidate division Zixibacteria bacterium]|nr:SpoIID/LytB domain-containing protein [candidate division Zixibacteria bacterium]
MHSNFNFHTILIITLLLVFAVYLGGCSNLLNHDGNAANGSQKRKDGGNVPEVAVQLLDNVERIEFHSDRPFVIVSDLGDNVKEEYFSISEIGIKSNSNGLEVNDKNYGELVSQARQVYFRNTSEDGIGYLNGDGYRGTIYAIWKENNGTIEVVNRLGIDDYLKGVLPKEMGRRSEEEFEALKAQAVAARTYAMYKLRRSGGKQTLRATVLDQVYGGYDIEDEMANRAIEETAGEVVMNDSNLIATYYFSTCGGKTESISEVWEGNRPNPSMVSIDDRNYCAWSKVYFWEDEFSRELLQARLDVYLKKLRGKGFSGVLRDVKVLSRSGSGRVRLMKFYTSREQFELKADKIRWAIRKSSDFSKILPSTLFDIKIDRSNSGDLEKVRFIGRGSGHGVGMCQCGAIGRARSGQRYREILNAYYTQIVIRKVY